MTFSSTSLQAFVGLFTLSKKRTEAYANADATVSLQRMSSYVQFDLFLILSSMLFHYFPLHVGRHDCFSVVGKVEFGDGLKRTTLCFALQLLLI